MGVGTMPLYLQQLFVTAVKNVLLKLQHSFVIIRIDVIMLPGTLSVNTLGALRMMPGVSPGKQYIQINKYHNRRT